MEARARARHAFWKTSRMTWINLAPRQLLEQIRDEYPATFRAFDLERVLAALKQETKYSMAEALSEFFRAPETLAPSADKGEK